jgi:hypothetical protein
MQEFMKFEIRDYEWAQELQNGLEEYMGKLYESVDSKKEPSEAKPITESGMPFCSCNLCEGREILFFLSPRIIKGYLDGKVGYADADESEVVEYLTTDENQGFPGSTLQLPEEN